MSSVVYVAAFVLRQYDSKFTVVLITGYLVVVYPRESDTTGYVPSLFTYCRI